MSAASLAKHYKEIDDAKLLARYLSEDIEDPQKSHFFLMMPSWNVGSLIFHARETLTCEICGERLRIEGELPGVTYCQVKPTLRSTCLKCVSLSALRHQSPYTEWKGQMVGDLSLKEKTFLSGEEITHQCRLETPQEKPSKCSDIAGNVWV